MNACSFTRLGRLIRGWVEIADPAARRKHGFDMR
jgi:hypothetical protein